MVDSHVPPANRIDPDATPPRITAKGTRFDVGFEHGRQARGLVEGTLEWSLRQLEIGGVNRREASKRAEILLPYVRSYAPELIEEAAGIAEGAGLAFLDIMIVNTRYELLFLGGSEAPRPGVAGAECTLFGASGERTSRGTPIIGQNVDLGADARPYWIVLDIEPVDAPRVLTVTMAGMLAQEGINAAGLALCGSMVRSGGWGPGFPTRKFLRRRVLEQRSVREAIRTIRDAPRRASSHNLLLADPTEVLGVETTAEDVLVIEPVEGTLVHTNHYLHPRSVHWNDSLGRYLVNSTARCTRVQELVDALTPPVSIEALKAVLSDHRGEPNAICRHADRDEWKGETNIAIIAEPEARRVHVAFGPPCTATFHTYSIAADSRA